MKKLILSILILLGTTQSQAKIADDKAQHMFAGVGIYVGCLMIKGAGEALKYDMDYLTTTTCLIPVVVAGVGKELYDANHDNHTAEWQDAVATIAIPLGMTVILYEF